MVSPGWSVAGPVQLTASTSRAAMAARAASRMMLTALMRGASLSARGRPTKMSSAQRAAAHSSVTSSGQGRSVHSPKAVEKVKTEASSVRSSVSAMRTKAAARCG